LTTSSIDPNLLDKVEPVEGRTAASRHVRIVDAIEPAILLVSIVFALTALTFAVVSWTGGFWLPLDAAHFSAEAEWLRGNRDVLPNIHPPLFPGLVLLADLVVGWRDAVLMAMSLAFALYVVAVYALLRRWHRRSFAWFGAVLAATSPVLAEILGWGGGANLLGFAALIGACAAAERWTETGRGALVSGVLCGCAGASHPLAGVLALVMVIGIVAAKSVFARRIPPRSLRAALLFGLGGLPFVAGAGYYYLSVSSPSQTTFGLPDLGVTLDMFDWAGREHVIITLIQLCALVWPFVARGQRSRPTGLVFAAVILLLTATLKGDPSYQSRVMYLLPVLVGIAAADIGSIAVHRSRVALQGRRTRSGALAAVAVIAVLFQVAFVTRLRDANDYYRRLTIDDVTLLQQIDDETGGIIASSHWAHSTAEPTGWFVNAAAKRRAVSPIGPWLSTDPSETREGAAMQRLFAGQVGIERNGLQVAASASARGLYSLQIAIGRHDWFEPVIVLDSARSRFPFTVVSASTRLAGDGIVLTLVGPDPDADIIELIATIDTSGVVVRGTPGPEVGGDWHVVFSWAPNTFGSVTPLDATTAEFELEVGRSDARGLLSVDADVPVRMTSYPTGLPVDLDVIDPSVLSVSWEFDERSMPTSEPTTFEESAILDEYEIDHVVVWNNTGLIQRFAESCFRQVATGPTITVFDRMDPSAPDCETG
jgi:hypothetical protein